ncbi:DUF1217 domain-containing protein [Paracoccus caeni]|uniref:DUF1217 domain-containing protein n=1 Tax=Paracoccus caeni TaxID=657651 RepID=A0A934S908_9RHOB|nr:DUF1217 domain-containing protein [Paracoccus caeni]MBK4214341.1 DUF1217 domain-containing protein [Paracoccus caeni]
MSVAISFGGGGIAGWRALQNGAARQLANVSSDPVVQRAIGQFRDGIGSVSTPEDLVNNYNLLRVALGAYGLEADIANKGFIRKVLESDVADSTSLVNRLSDKRYLRLARALNLGAGEKLPNTEALKTQIADAYIQREYERRVGNADESLRLALNAQRELQSFATRTSSDKTMWYEVLGNPPLRKVFEVAFGFGSHYGKLPVDRQLSEYMKAAERVFGSSSFKQIASQEGIDKLVTSFLAREQLVKNSVGQSRYSAALHLLSMAAAPRR